MTNKKEKLLDFVKKIKKLGYTNDKAKDGIDRQAFGAEFGVGYHAVRFWLNGTNPIPEYARNFVERELAAKTR